ncbi:MAG TPA: alcohol dehydrogenase catalytic domain-containing protein [Planctomycetes bacterium]|nr:alcohol dehydrogenase catalytic domain-containing protein [Planctomycetota bacterium]
MTRRMKAVVYYAPKDVRIEDISVPKCADDEIRVRVDACAVCGSDLKAYMEGNPRIKPPMVVGHEFTGLVETVGARIKGFKCNERVVMATSVSCGRCFYCRNNRPNLCTDLRPMGYVYPGGFAEFVTIPARALEQGHVIKVPDGVKAHYAALAEPLSCAVNCAENCNIGPGDTVVVVGAGPMGIMNACVAKEFGAGKIIIAEINEIRLKQSGNFGFDLVIDSARQDLCEIVKRETDGIGADVVIVAAPAAGPQEKAIGVARKHGTVCLFASLPAGKSMLSLDSRVIHYGEIRLIGTSDSAPKHVTKAVELLHAGYIPVDKLASHILGLDDIFKAYELMQSGEALRVVLEP